MSGDKWLVGRQETCYVEQAEPLVIAGVDCGEQVFDTEAEALAFAIECDVTIRDNLSRNISDLRSRLRRTRALATTRSQPVQKSQPAATAASGSSQHEGASS